MSDEPFIPPIPGLMSALRARNLARHYKGFSDNLRRSGFEEQAVQAERDSVWWMTFAISLAQTPPSAIDKHEAP